MSDMEIIGDLYGAHVLIDRGTQSVIIQHDAMPSIKFSIDHPDIQGTKIEKWARRALAESPQGTSDVG